MSALSPKNKLQEIYQKRHEGLPSYKTEQTVDGMFISTVMLPGIALKFKGDPASTKVRAEEIAADKALKYVGSPKQMRQPVKMEEKYDSGSDGSECDGEEILVPTRSMSAVSTPWTSSNYEKSSTQSAFSNYERSVSSLYREYNPSVSTTPRSSITRPSHPFRSRKIALIDLENASKNREYLEDINEFIELKLYLTTGHALSSKVVGFDLETVTSGHKDAVDTKIIIDATRLVDRGEFETIYVVTLDHFSYPLVELLGPSIVRVTSLADLKSIVIAMGSKN